jgi:hypothetical protein
MLLLCGLLVATLFMGAYDDDAFGFAQGAYMVFLIAFLSGMLVLLLEYVEGLSPHTKISPHIYLSVPPQ